MMHRHGEEVEAIDIPVESNDRQGMKFIWHQRLGILTLVFRRRMEVGFEGGGQGLDVF